MIKLIVIELIVASNHSNLKTRKLAEECFLSISSLLRGLGAVAQLF